MKSFVHHRCAVVLTVSALALTSCGTSGEALESQSAQASEASTHEGWNFEGEGGVLDFGEVTGTLNGGGASSHEPAMKRWVEIFAQISSATVNYASVGSGDGRAGLMTGEYAFAGSDAVLNPEEMQEAQDRCGPQGAFHLPTYVSPIAVAVNLDGVDEVNLSAETLADIFAGEITHWDDPRIAEHNEEALPSTGITVIHRSDNSGTTENLTEYLEAAAYNWEYPAGGDWPEELTAEFGSGTGGVLEELEHQEGGITYSDAGQVPEEFVKASLYVGGEYTDLSPEDASQAVSVSERLEGGPGNDMGFVLSRDTEEIGTYPLVQIAYTVWCNQYDSEEEAQLAAAFATYLVSEEAQATAANAAGASPMPEELRTEALDSIDRITW
ncbi:phosphate ABC transporter substrate-binding protein PstS [Nesterenkonia populi]